MSNGEGALYNGLCRQLISRIMTADAKCDPPTDIDLRLASIVGERDHLRAENERLREALQRIKAEAPTRLTVGDWSPVEVSEIARRALEGE